jgi:hypothetical protein
MEWWSEGLLYLPTRPNGHPGGLPVANCQLIPEGLFSQREKLRVLSSEESFRIIRNQVKIK